eukprot:1176525-Prorocentrum_minimum.AAC.2
MGSFPPMGRRCCGPFCGFHRILSDFIGYYRILSDPQRSAKRTRSSAIGSFLLTRPARVRGGYTRGSGRYTRVSGRYTR